MEVADLIAPSRVVASLRAATKRQVLQELARRAASETAVHERKIFDALLERERLGTTGLGMGTAIPHAKLPELKRLSCFFARLDRPVDFAAIDEAPVDLVFMLLAPETAGADHLKALARLSRLMRDRVVCEKLRGTDNPEALYALLTDEAATHAA